MNSTLHPVPGMSPNEFLSAFVKGKTVLDLGCVAHEAREEESEFWLHKHLIRSAKSVLGVDVLEEDINVLRQRGYNMICADATTVSLDQTFDVVVAGELIEHVVNPGGLLSNMRRHLNENGRLIITTPYAYYLLNSLVALLSRQARFWHPDHVAWYCPYVLKSMLQKTGYEMEACYYFNRSRKLRSLFRALHAPCYRLLGQTIIVIARPLHSQT